MPSVYQEEIEAEDAAYLALVEKGSWAQPEAAEGYFPEIDGLSRWRIAGAAGDAAARCRGLRNAYRRQPQRLDALGLGRLRRDLEQAGRGSDRGQPLPGADRSTPKAAPRWSSAGLRPSRPSAPRCRCRFR